MVVKPKKSIARTQIEDAVAARAKIKEREYTIMWKAKAAESPPTH